MRRLLLLTALLALGAPPAALAGVAHVEEVGLGGKYADSEPARRASAREAP